MYFLTVILVGAVLALARTGAPVKLNLNSFDDSDYLMMRMCSTRCNMYETCLVKNGIPHCLHSCPRSCSAKNNPVCGSDGQTHTNQCLLRMRNCNSGEDVKVMYKGGCKPAPGTTSPRAKRCSKDCSFAGDRAVCGSDGKTYKNFCEVSQARCRSGASVSFEHYGACEKDECSHVKCPWGQVCQISVTRGPVCQCNSQCPAEPAVICAADGKSYYNQCHLEAENCLRGRDVRVRYKGICRGDKSKRNRIHRASVAFSPV